MASSTISGVGSGVDTQAIVKALVAAEKAPKQAQITAQQKTTTTQLSAVGSVKSAMEAYRAAIAKLNTASSFTGLAATSSEEKFAKVTLGDSASSGSYALHVEKLATASKTQSAVFADGASTVVNSGSEAQILTISQSDSDHRVSIPAGATLQQTRDLINTQLQSKGLSANILTDANGSRLVMTSQTTGKGSDITVASGALGLGTFTRVGELAQNAEYTIDGIAMESTSNKVTSAISGVNLELVAKGDSSIKVASNTDTLKTSVQSFVTAYNALIGSINSQTKVTATGETATTTAGALTGDATMRQLVSTLRGELLNGSGSGALASLSQIGLNTDQKTGLLSLDNKKWDKAVATGGADVAGLFTGDKGLITRMTKATDSYVGTTGVLASRTSSLDAKLTDLDTEQKALDRRIESLQLSLSAKYNAMDSLVAKLRASSSSIMTTLNSLNNPKTT